MANIGVDWFYDKDLVNIKIVNTDAVSQNKEYFNLLNGLTIENVKRCWQSYFERGDGGSKLPIGGPVNGNIFFAFTAAQVVPLLEKANKETELWKKLEPDTEVKIISTACEVIN
jgi:hypothetical protein